MCSIYTGTLEMWCVRHALSFQVSCWANIQADLFSQTERVRTWWWGKHCTLVPQPVSGTGSRASTSNCPFRPLWGGSQQTEEFAAVLSILTFSLRCSDSQPPQVQPGGAQQGRNQGSYCFVPSLNEPALAVRFYYFMSWSLFCIFSAMSILCPLPPGKGWPVCTGSQLQA